MGLESESGETSCEDLDSSYTPDSKELAAASENEGQIKLHCCVYDDCKASFRRPWRLAAHECTHTGERPFKCLHGGCTKAYTNSTHLRRHMSVSHAPGYKKIYVCPYDGCGMELSSTTSLKKHYMRIHEATFPYSCQYCDKGFKKHHQLKTHMYEHTGVAPFRFDSPVEQLDETHSKGGICCTVCLMSFTTGHTLKRHMRGHRTYTCNVPECKQVFNTWTLLRKHYKLQHPVELNCSYCAKVFRNKAILRSHLKVHEEPNEREILPCPYNTCHRFYYEIKNLSHHIRSSHEGKKHKCTHPGCERHLCTRVKLREHMKLHDPKRSLPTKKRKPRKIRRDVGIPKRSMAVKLSGVKVSYQTEKAVLQLNSTEEHAEGLEKQAQEVNSGGPTGVNEIQDDCYLVNNSQPDSAIETNTSNIEQEDPVPEKVQQKLNVPDSNAHEINNPCIIDNNEMEFCEEITSDIDNNVSTEQVFPLDLSTKVCNNPSSIGSLRDTATEKRDASPDESVTYPTLEVKKVPQCNTNPDHQHSGIPMGLHKWIMLMLDVMDEFFPDMREGLEPMISEDQVQEHQLCVDKVACNTIKKHVTFKDITDIIDKKRVSCENLISDKISNIGLVKNSY